MIILSWTWVFMKSLFCIWSFTFISPKICSLSFWKEALWLLSDKLSINVSINTINCIFLYWNHCFVCTWAWLFILNLCVFTIWNLWLKDTIISIGIEIFLSSNFKIIHSRTWIYFLINSWLKCPSFYLISNKIYFICFWFRMIMFRVISCRSNGVLSKSSISSLS